MKPCLYPILIVMAAAALVWGGCGGDSDCANKTEVCDNQDNNCNGAIDDGIPPRACTSDCGNGTEQCVNGQWVNCNAPQPGVETCNGLDDDCDTCIDEQPGTDCRPLQEPCSTDCGTGTRECYLGSWRECSAPQPQNETCNGEDDDCDGSTDEGLDVDSDNDGHYSLTSCAQPHDDCNDNNNAVYPGHPEGPDFCDGIDNNCNQQIDEGCECSPGPPPETKPCSTEVGECTIGVQTCQADGSFGDCSGQTPVDEICDNKDNDCDGVTDNVVTPPACELSQGVCEGVTRVGCQPCNYGPTYEIVELSCDGLDNNCDGTTDANLPADSFEANEVCSNPALISNVNECAGPTEVSKTLYKYDQGYPVLDVDWFSVTTVEGSHLGCTPFEAQQFVVWFVLELPAGVDEALWELCVRPDDCGGTEFCTDGDNWNPTYNRYELGLTWDTGGAPWGGCGLDDSATWLAAVQPAQGPITECDEYNLQVYFQCTENCGEICVGWRDE